MYSKTFQYIYNVFEDFPMIPRLYDAEDFIMYSKTL